MNNSKKSAAIGFIFITMLLDITGWGIIIPVMPKLIAEISGQNIAYASKISGWMGFAYAFTQFIFAPMIGNLSDRYGRRPVLLMSIAGFALDYILLALAPNLFWLFVGRILAGFTGASLSTATAYIADISTAENRAKNFGMVGAAFGMGFILGPMIGGLLGQYNPRWPFYAAAILCFLNAIYGYFWLPESLKPEHRRAFSWKNANPISAILSLKKYPKIMVLMLSFMLLHIASHAVHSNWNFYCAYRFAWDERMIGISLAFIGLLVALVQGLLVRKINPRLGDAKSIYIGFFCYALGMFLFTLATETWWMFLFLIPYCLGGICGPALQSVITTQVDATQQGQIQGVLTSLVSLAAIVGPPLMTNVFYQFTKTDAPILFPGMPFALASAMMLLSAGVSYYHLKKRA
jgi:MFS transporter, DHA1 family, tetracycline resistance protein